MASRIKDKLQSTSLKHITKNKQSTQKYLCQNHEHHSVLPDEIIKMIMNLFINSIEFYSVPCICHTLCRKSGYLGEWDRKCLLTFDFTG